MKKILLLLVLFCLICTLAACKQPSITSDATSNVLSDNKTIHITTSSKEDTTSSDYTFKDISDKRITTIDNKKNFVYSGIAISFPTEWKCTESNGEDGSSYFFSHPQLSKKCQFAVSITSVEYLNERTQNEYLEYLYDVVGKDAKIKSFTKEKFNGYDCTKIMSSYSSENTQFVRIDYNNIAVGIRLYNFIINYPSSEKETFEPIFNSMVNSIEFIAD